MTAPGSARVVGQDAARADCAPSPGANPAQTEAPASAAAIPPAPAGRRVLVPASIAPHAPAFGGCIHTLHGQAMGTGWMVRWVGPPQADPEPVRVAIERELDDVVAQMSHWAPQSDLGRFNRAEAGRWKTIPAAFADVLGHALALARDTGGAFDPCAGALVDAWGFGPGGGHAEPGFLPPTAAAIADALARSGWRRLAFVPATRQLRQPGGLKLDLSAIAKGHAVDRVADALARQCSIESALVEVGGELRGSGLKPDGQPWWVTLQRPDGASRSRPETLVALHGLAIATSGDDQRYFEHEGLRVAHTIDPRSGRPVDNGVASVTVLHASCMAADALATALTVLGPQAGRAWAAERGIAAHFAMRQGAGLEERLTPAFAALAG